MLLAAIVAAVLGGLLLIDISVRAWLSVRAFEALFYPGDDASREHTDALGPADSSSLHSTGATRGQQ
jgi:hypothetical protein